MLETYLKKYVYFKTSYKIVEKYDKLMLKMLQSVLNILIRVSNKTHQIRYVVTHSVHII